MGAAAASSLTLERVSGRASLHPDSFISPVDAADHVVLWQGPAVRDPYGAAAGLPWWKGQLHTHTARSFDGDATVPPEKRAAQYQAVGYDFAVLTDHDRVSTVPDESLPTGRPFL